MSSEKLFDNHKTSHPAIDLTGFKNPLGIRSQNMELFSQQFEKLIGKVILTAFERIFLSSY